MTDKDARIAELTAALLDVTASLVAATSLLKRGGKAAKKAAPSDKMFDMMLTDYEGSIERARRALAGDGSAGAKVIQAARQVEREAPGYIADIVRVPLARLDGRAAAAVEGVIAALDAKED